MSAQVFRWQLSVITAVHTDNNHKNVLPVYIQNSLRGRGNEIRTNLQAEAAFTCIFFFKLRALLNYEGFFFFKHHFQLVTYVAVSEYLAPAENSKKRTTAHRWNTHSAAVNTVNKLYFVNFFLIKKRSKKKTWACRCSEQEGRGGKARLVQPWAWKLGLDPHALKYSLSPPSLYLSLGGQENHTVALAGLAVLWGICCRSQPLLISCRIRESAPGAMTFYTGCAWRGSLWTHQFVNSNLRAFVLFCFESGSRVAQASLTLAVLRLTLNPTSCCFLIPSVWKTCVRCPG